MQVLSGLLLSSSRYMQRCAVLSPSGEECVLTFNLSKEAAPAQPSIMPPGPAVAGPSAPLPGYNRVSSSGRVIPGTGLGLPMSGVQPYHYTTDCSSVRRDVAGDMPDWGNSSEAGAGAGARAAASEEESFVEGVEEMLGSMDMSVYRMDDISVAPLTSPVTSAMDSVPMSAPAPGSAGPVAGPEVPAMNTVVSSWKLSSVRGEPRYAVLPSVPSPEFSPEAVVEAQLNALRWVGGRCAVAGPGGCIA